MQAAWGTKKLKALAQPQSPLTGIRETWWDESCDTSAMLDGYRPLRRIGRGGEIGGGVVCKGKGWNLWRLQLPKAQMGASG